MSALRDCKQKHIGTAVPFSIGCYSKKQAVVFLTFSFSF